MSKLNDTVAIQNVSISTGVSEWAVFYVPTNTV